MPRARKPPAVVSAIRSAIARAAWGKLSADERKARQQRIWAKRKAAPCPTCKGQGYDESPHYYYGRMECPSCKGAGLKYSPSVPQE